MIKDAKWIEGRASHHANRLRDLITEALADGVVLSVALEDAPPKAWQPEQIIQSRIYPVPLAGGVAHEHLPNPLSVSATWVLQEHGSVAAVPVEPPVLVQPKLPKLEPIYDGSPLFVNPSLVQPWGTTDPGRMTSALAFGNSFNYLALCGHVAAPGLDPHITLERVWYQLDGLNQVFSEDTHAQVFSSFVASPLGGYSEMVLDFTFGQARGGQMLRARIAGTVNLRTGTLSVDCDKSDIPGLKLVGFSLFARPAHQ